MAESLYHSNPQLQEQDEIARNAALNRNLSLAEALPCVKNGFIFPEQAAYCIGWKDIVNPTSETQTILYNAMGPDVLTPLLTANAKTVYGVDLRSPEPEKTRRYLAAWDRVDTDALTLAPDKEYFRVELEQDGIEPTDENVQQALTKTISLRSVRGYWDIGEMDDWSIERCLMIELKKMRVDPTTIHISEVNGLVQLSFPWAYPGEQPKQRTVQYVADMTYDIIANPQAYHLQPLQGYYEKAMEIFNRDADGQVNDLRDIARYIQPQGFVLIGRGRGIAQEEQILEQSNRQALGTAFTPIDIGQEYKVMMHQQFGKSQRNSRYGWDLYGARKLP